jgi:uncharacterized protein (UPF0335 family)
MAKKKDPHTSAGSNAGAELRQFVERIERLEEEKATIGTDIKDVYSEAKGRGYDNKVIRRVIRDRKQDAEELQTFENLVDTYKAALGMLPAEDDTDDETDGAV